ncbi:hypothetical protein [Bradyrhizobium sp. 195]|uniref:hypothetical protein n=1 Tax=Bradyrhizobium sp. 195 TaxID=2782662 RepID=UPI002000D30D|nr:hypothetical protein [Bradyrhizobium sp. 195]UPK26526.1 hypothetical protein IVB26_35660 [Bradyrhizobium sp. 195]
MQDPVAHAGYKAHQSSIALFVLSRHLIQLRRQSAVAHGESRGRPQAGAPYTRLSGASTMACSRYGGDLAGFAILLLAGVLVISEPNGFSTISLSIHSRWRSMRFGAKPPPAWMA